MASDIHPFYGTPQGPQRASQEGHIYMFLYSQIT